MQTLNVSLFKLGTEDEDTRFEMDLENIEAFEENLKRQSMLKEEEESLAKAIDFAEFYGYLPKPSKKTLTPPRLYGYTPKSERNN